SPHHGRLAHTRGAPTDRLANRCYSPPPTRGALALDCPGSRHLPAACSAASGGAACADTLPSRNTSDCEPADTAETPRRTRRTADPPFDAPAQPNLGGVRHRPAVNGLLTNSGERRKQWDYSTSPFCKQTPRVNLVSAKGTVQEFIPSVKTCCSLIR